MTLNISDNDLVGQLQKGDVEAFDKIYEKYSAKLYGFGLKYLKSKDETEELVQAVFLKLWENHKNLRKETSFKSYLFTIAYNEICNLFRKRNYQQRFSADYRNENSLSSTETEESIDYKSTMEQAKKIINMLPERQRTVFIKSRQEGKSTKEIAEELNLSPGTVDNYISDALKSIRKKMKKENLTVFLLFSLFFF